MKETDAERLQAEYRSLVEGLRRTNKLREADEILENPGFTLIVILKMRLISFRFHHHTHFFCKL